MAVSNIMKENRENGILGNNGSLIELVCSFYVENSMFFYV